MSATEAADDTPTSTFCGCNWSFMSLFSTVSALRDTAHGLVREGVVRTTDQIKGILNPDHRHDEPHEQAHDATLASIRAQHRFQSFANERPDNFVKWHIDGHDYFWAVSTLIDSAREAIFILDWWLSPEIYLRRPPADFPEWRLDRLLKRKAEQGVKVYVIVYKEVTQAMSMSSRHSKNALEELHPNIAVMRHPDHIGATDTTEIWSHHEKVVVVDNHMAAIGGLDLCFGRWDTHNHPVADAHPTDFSATLFPGQDYNNGRVADFQTVDHFVNNSISILETGRMPWHDVHMTVVGPSVLDIVQHFVERWNEVKKRKYKNESRYDWLSFPHDTNAAPEEPILRHPHLQAFQEVGRRYRQRFQRGLGWQEIENDHDYGRNREEPHGTCRVQVVRSVSDWSHGTLTEHSIQNAYIQLIHEANHFIYIENQFFISNTGPHGPVQNRIAEALVSRILTAARNHQKFKVVVLIPEVPGFAGDIKDQSSIQTIMAAQWRTMNRGGHSIYEEIRNAGFEPMDYIRFYHLRSFDRINAPYASFISRMEAKSGVTFHQAQVALARYWIGNPMGWHQDTITIKVPQPTGEGIVPTGPATTQTVPFPPSEEEAERTVRRFESGARGERSDQDVSDSVAQHALLDRTSLWQERWLGTPEEERDCIVTELLYIHSKVMIVDDKRVIMGSANINDRSQKGDGDSEIALVVEDTDFIESRMDGKPYTASRFAATLRRKLYREHLGLIEPQNCEQGRVRETSFMKPAPTPNRDEIGTQEDRIVEDPLSHDLDDLWKGTARRNREIFAELFRTVPSDNVRNWQQYQNYVPKVKPGRLALDVSLDRAKERLSNVRGHLVEAPLEFLSEQQDLVDNPNWKGLNPTLPIYI